MASPTPKQSAERARAARSYAAEWNSIMRGARPPVWRVAWSSLLAPLSLEAGLAAIAWYGLRLRSPGFICLFAVAVGGIFVAFPLFLHRSGYRPMNPLTKLGLDPGIPWRRPAPCVYDLDREREDPEVLPDAKDADPRIAELFGPLPTVEEMTAVRASAAAIRRSAEARVLERCVTVRASGGFIDISRRRVLRRIHRGRLLALHRDATYYVPSWQVRGRGFLAGVDDVIAAWRGSPLALADWAEQLSVDLDDRTPAQALADGDVRAVLELEASIVAASW